METDLVCNVAPTWWFPERIGGKERTGRATVCYHIESAREAGNEADEIRGWKALLSSDALLFTDVKGSEAQSRRALIADRLHMLEQGLWGALWAQARSGRSSQREDSKSVPETERMAGRVRILICPLYTSDAADDLTRLELGWVRIARHSQTNT